MTSHRTGSRLTLALLASILAVLATTSGAQAAEAPVKEIFASHIGWDVNKVKLEAGAPQSERNVCTVISKEACQLGTESTVAGGFSYPGGVAVNNDPASPEYGDLYVADAGNSRVDVVTSTGGFVLMFGAHVNGKTGGDICAASEESSCQAAAAGGEAGALSGPSGITVDASTGNVYVEDHSNWRVDEYAAGGQFIAMFGREVNETSDDTPASSQAEKNICTAVSKDVCKAGEQGTPGAGEQDAFNFAAHGDVLTVAGSEGLLYVGEEGNVQELKADGAWVNNVPMAGNVSALAVDGKTNTLYVVDNEEPLIHEFDLATGQELEATIKVPNAILLRGAAIDFGGGLAVSIYSEGENGRTELHGDLYEASSGTLISSIAVPALSDVSGASFTGLGLSENGDLYGVNAGDQEVLGYDLLPVAQATTGTGVCSTGAEHETAATFDCVLHGEVNPYQVPSTEAGFEWGKTCAFGSSTAKQGFGTVEADESFTATLDGVRPNETLCFRAVSEDENARAPEVVAGELAMLTTPPVLPKIVTTSASFATTSSVVLFAELNPENASTEYYFELAAEPEGEAKLAACRNAKESDCAGVITTQTGESSVYGIVGATIEAAQLQPATTYHYRLNAKNDQDTQAELRAVSGQGTFRTVGAPVVEAVTGSVSGVTQTSAHVEGAVNPDGAQATYTFELGVEEGTQTQYDIVASGSTGAGTTPEAEFFTLSGLRPGVTYAYRIAIHSGYGSAQGASGTFTTAGVPVALTAPITSPLLATPAIAFPTQAKGAVATTTKRLTRAQKLAKALRVCKRRKAKGGRMACERVARKRWGRVGKKAVR
ncbi:MAG TPA: hypothetical protein VGL57_14620 [Solirubrobacteraceae bacterium]|jgi:hypothetical protein